LSIDIAIDSHSLREKTEALRPLARSLSPKEPMRLLDLDADDGGLPARVHRADAPRTWRRTGQGVGGRC
jgi:hypothetical protein